MGEPLGERRLEGCRRQDCRARVQFFGPGAPLDRGVVSG